LRHTIARKSQSAFFYWFAFQFRKVFILFLDILADIADIVEIAISPFLIEKSVL